MYFNFVPLMYLTSVFYIREVGLVGLHCVYELLTLGMLCVHAGPSGRAV